MTAEKHIHSPDHHDYHPMLLSSQNEPTHTINSYEDKGDRIELTLSRNGKTIVRHYEEGSHWVISEENKNDRYFGTDINLSIYEPPVVLDAGVDMSSFERQISRKRQHLADALEYPHEDLKYSHTDDIGSACFIHTPTGKLLSTREVFKKIDDEFYGREK